jgi:hypothetical protein
MTCSAVVGALLGSQSSEQGEQGEQDRMIKLRPWPIAASLGFTLILSNCWVSEVL